MSTNNDAYPTIARVASMFVFFFVTIVSFSLAWPFQPYEQLNIVSMPDDVCTNEGVQVLVEREIDTPLFSSLSRAVVTSTWIEVESEQAEAAGTVPIPLEDTELEVIESPILREAPPDPGNYYLYIETTVYGYVGVMPRDTTIAIWSGHPIKVTKC